MSSLPESTTALVIIATFSLARWDLLVESVDAVQAQTYPPLELIICVDHNPELLQRCEEAWAGRPSPAGFPVVIVANRFSQSRDDGGTYAKAHGSTCRFGAGWNRNTGAELAVGDVLAFLDDDAVAEATWLEQLLVPFEDGRTVAVGGRPFPATRLTAHGGSQQTLIGSSVAPTQECRQIWHHIPV